MSTKNELEKQSMEDLCLIIKRWENLYEKSEANLELLKKFIKEILIHNFHLIERINLINKSTDITDEEIRKALRIAELNITF